MRSIADGKDLGRFDKSVVQKVKNDVAELEKSIV